MCAHWLCGVFDWKCTCSCNSEHVVEVMGQCLGLVLIFHLAWDRIFCCLAPCIHQAYWLIAPGYSLSASYFGVGMLGLCNMDSGDMNSGLCACKARTLFSKLLPSPQSLRVRKGSRSEGRGLRLYQQLSWITIFWSVATVENKTVTAGGRFKEAA